MSTTDELGPSGVGQASPGGMYARKATGLVREVSPFSTFVFNMAGQPTAILLAVGVFFTLGINPGGSLWVGFAIAFPAAIVLSVAYGLFTSAIPRSGGDYVLVGRVMHPAIGLVSSFLWVVGVILSIAFFAQTFITIAIAPSLTALGLVSGHHSLVTAGDTLTTSKAWQFGVGTALILIASAFLAGGWRITTRILNALWALMFIGLGTTLVVLLFTSQSSFVASFNRFARPITHEPDTYHRLIAAAPAAGVPLHPAFSMNNTWPTFAAIAGFTFFGWLSIYISGEVRKARDTTQMKVMSLAVTVSIATAVLLSLVMFSTFGHNFFVAINGLSATGSKAYPFAAPPYYTFMASIAGGSTFLAWLLFVTFAAAYPLLIIQNTTLAVRSFFAWGLDGLLPLRVSKVSPKTHAPNVAVGVTAVLSILVLLWAVTNAHGFLTIFAEAVLLQLVTMTLLALSAMLLPYRRPEIWRASVMTRKFLGIPVISWAGAVSAVILIGLGFIFLKYPQLGIVKSNFFVYLGAIVAAALLTFYGTRIIRMRQGVDVEKLASEIPPE